MKGLVIAFLLTSIKNCSSQTVLSSSGVCMDMSEDLKEFVRTVLSRAFVDIKEDISHAVRTQSEKWSAENKQTRVLVDILDEKQVNTVYSIKELKEGLTNISYRTDFLLHASRSAFLEKITNLSDAIHGNHLHMKTVDEEMVLLHYRYWNQTDNLTELSNLVTLLSVQYNWTVSNISELYLNIRKMGEISAEQILHTLARVNQTEDDLKRFFVENLQNKTKELFDQFSMLRRDVTHLSESAVTQSELTEQSINFLKENLQNETNELQVIRENLTYMWESAATQAGWTQTSILQLKDSVQNETSELSGHISFLQENITNLSESAVTQEKSILRLKEENKELKSMLERLQTEINELKQNVSASMARYWTGGTDQDTEGQWVWASSGNVFRFSDWYSGEPNNAGEEDCMELRVSMQEKAWNDIPCQTEFKFICERLSN
ncbi:uncharacterized protein LOC111133342 isoform X2 [Crassostrea virginica]